MVTGKRYVTYSLVDVASSAERLSKPIVTGGHARVQLTHVLPRSLLPMLLLMRGMKPPSAARRLPSV